MPHLMSWIEGTVAGAFTMLFLLYAVFAFKPEHVAHHPLRVWVGAGLQGFIIGVLVGFVILPLRFALFLPPDLVPELPTPPRSSIATLSVLPALLLLLVIRRGVLARAPLIGRYLRAYRRAALKHQIDSMRNTLARLERIDTRPATEL